MNPYLNNPGYQPPKNPIKAARKARIYAEMDSLPHDPYITGTARSYEKTLRGRGKTRMVDKGLVEQGHVYVVTNPAWPGYVKIGKAAVIEKRLRSFQTSSPFRDFKLEESVLFSDMQAAELAVHAALKAVRVDGTEWFKVSIREAAAEVHRVKKNLERK